jgi:hypothetical protein
MRGYDVFALQLDEAVEAFPLLQKAVLGGKDILKGVINITDSNGKHWENYEVEIHASENFPFQFPLLFETSGKIPKIADWHIYEDTLSCCIRVTPDEIIRCKNGISVTEYIKEEVYPYLFNQTHRRVEGYYVNGEYSHGLKGIYEFYSDVLKTGDDIMKTVELMTFIATHSRPGRTSQCFCGQKTKFRHCHRNAFDKLKLIGDQILQSNAANFANAISCYGRQLKPIPANGIII